MGLRGRLSRLEREAQSEGVILRLRDGSLRVFDKMKVFGEMFMMWTDLLVRDESRPSEVLDAVRAATPESRASFEVD